jgi:hypothetical protein
MWAQGEDHFDRFGSGRYGGMNNQMPFALTDPAPAIAFIA